MRKATIRLVWLLFGILALALGIVGAVLPLLPTTPFLLLAAFSFARSSPKLHAWLLAHPQFGPMIRNWERYGAIDRRAKRVALVVIALTPVITWLIGAPLWALATQFVVLVAVATFILTRPTPEQARDRQAAE